MAFFYYGNLTVKFCSSKKIITPAGATASDIWIDWDETHKLFRVYGWFDIPNTIGYDPNRNFYLPLPAEFPDFTINTNISTGTPCIMASSYGVIYGALILDSVGKQIILNVPHGNIEHVFMQQIMYTYN